MSRAARSARWIITAHFAVATPVLYALGLATYSFHALINTSLGFRPEGVLSAQIPQASAMVGDTFSFEASAQRVASLDLLVERVARLPGVEQVAVSSDRLGFIPTRDRVRVRWPESREQDSLVVQLAEVSSGYFDLLGIPLVAGRTFERRSAQAMDWTDVYGGVVVDSTFVASLGGATDVVGRTIILDFTPATIIGVVGPVRPRRPDEPLQPRVYVSISPAASGATNLLVRFSGPSDHLRGLLGRTIQDELRTLAPADTVLLTDELRRLQMGYRGRYELLSLMGWIAAALCAAGTFAVAAYTVARRRRELAVRMAIGGSRRRILWTCAKDLLVASAAGIAVGLAGGVFVGRHAVHLLYGVSPVDPLVLSAIVALLAFAVLVGAIVPLRSAWRTDVAAVLRQE